MSSLPPDLEARYAERARMVDEQLAGRGIAAPSVLDAMKQVPREWFMSAEAADRAYLDGAQPIDCEQTISQPYMVARMTELLQLRPTDRVLEIGTGSGYQTAVLATIAKAVYTVEWHQRLINQAAARLEALGLRNIEYHCGDGSLGWPEQAPFDAIIATAGAPDIPNAYREQLGPRGRLVIPIGPLADQRLVVLKRGDEGFHETEVLKCRFVKLRGAHGWRDEDD